VTGIEHRGVCLVLSAPSGAGKTAIADALVASEPDLLRSVSVTTRAARPDEVDGVHYHFVDQPEFDRMTSAGELLEWARVLGRHCYGTPRAPVERALRELERRLRHRSGDDASEIARRMQRARDEAGHWPEYDHVVVNEILDAAVAAVRAVLHAARSATGRLTGLRPFVERL
jgi:guanylate kinase